MNCYIQEQGLQGSRVSTELHFFSFQERQQWERERDAPCSRWPHLAHTYFRATGTSSRRDGRRVARTESSRGRCIGQRNAGFGGS